MRGKHWLLLLLAVIAVTAFAGGLTPTATPAASPTPTATPSLPVLMGTPIPLPAEPITPDNVDRIRQLAMWGQGNAIKVSYSPDGRFLALGSTVGIWLYEADTQEFLRFILTKDEPVAMTFVPDNETITAVLDTPYDWGGNSIIRWNAATGELLGSWQVGVRRLWNAAISPDGQTVASALEDGQIGIWEIESGQLLKTLGQNSEPDFIARAIAFSPNGTLLASTGPKDNNTIRLWDVDSEEIVQLLPGQRDNVESDVVTLSFSPDGTLLASTATNGTIELYNLETSSVQHTLMGAGRVAFSSDSRHLAASTMENNIWVWDVTNGQQVQTIADTGRINDLQFSSDGTTLTSVERRSRPRLWDVKNGTLLNELDGYANGALDLAVGTDGTIFTGHSDGNIHQWDIASGRVVNILSGHTSDVTNLAISTDGSTLVSGEEQSNKAWIWDAVDGRLIRTFPALFGTDRSVAVSPDGQLLAAGNESSAISLFSVQTGKKLYLLGLPIRHTEGLTFSPDNTRLLSSTGGNLNLWQIDTGELVKYLGLGAYAFSPDGQTIIMGGLKGHNTLSILDAHTGEPLGEKKVTPPTGMSELRYSPDGKLWVSTLDTIALWNAETGRRLRVLDTPPVSSVTFTPDNKVLVMETESQTVQFWGVPPQ